MRTLFIDNIDSFVYNLVQYVGMNRGNPVVVQNTATESEIDSIVANGIDRIIISPGPKSPKDAGISNYVIKKYGPKIPLLGVCLGHQCIGYVYGGKIRHAKNIMHGKTSKIKHDGSGLLKGIPSPFDATRYHSLVVEENGLSSDLVVFARAEDDNEIMAMRHRIYPIFGVQFHPESIKTEHGMKIIKNFMEEIK
jgi:anthranilate synthase/aminodeoxychorismate synthase-like glutamine amidotransferase